MPTAAELERLRMTANRAMAHVRNSASSARINADVNFGGSYAKGTGIRGKSDIDISVAFDSEKETKLLSRLVPKGFEEQRGTRVYYRGKINGVYIEIVPVVKFVKIKDVKNSIDLSVLHAGYIKKRLKDSLKKDVIILKQFCKASGCYGSETFRHGFSGYSLELLVAHYGGVMQLFRAASRWRPPVFIDMAKQYKDEASAVKGAGSSGSPLLLVDPTNPKRNVCGSLNRDNLAKFVFSVKRFMLSPSFESFVEKDTGKLVRSSSRRRGTMLFEHTTRVSGPKDRFLSMYNKALSKLLDNLSGNGVEVYDCTPIYGEKSVRMLLEVASVPCTKTHRVDGPEVWLPAENFAKYLAGHKDAYVYGEHASYDKPYAVKNFKRFIEAKIKEYIAPGAIFKN